MIRRNKPNRSWMAAGLWVISWCLAGSAAEAHFQLAEDSSKSAPDTATRPADNAQTAGESPEGEITDANRVLRLETSIVADEKHVTELEEELAKSQAEENRASLEAQALATQIEETQLLLQKAQDAGDQEEAQKQQMLLTDLETSHKLAIKQLDQALQTRRTVNEQIATLRLKIAKDRTSLDKLKGTPSPGAEGGESAPAAQNGQEPAGGPDSPPEQKPDENPQPAEAGDAPQEKQADKEVSKDLAKAREEVMLKEKSLQELEEDLEALAASAALLEKSVELESEKLESARRKYDSSEEAIDVAEQEFNDQIASGTPSSELTSLRDQIGESKRRMREARGEIRASTDRLQRLRSELLTLQAERTQLVQQSDDLHREMVAAQRSEFIVKTRDYLYAAGPKIFIILLLTVVLWSLLKLLCSRSRALIARAGRGAETERQNRADTLAGVFQNTGNTVIALGSVLMTLDAAGVPIAALLGGAGVVGLAVAFGAQSLMKDYFCGFILLMENQYKVNDFVTICDLSGWVERITLRVTVLRSFEGKVHFVPNGQITSVTNATLDWARAVLEIGVAYKENVDQVIAELKLVTQSLRKDPEYGVYILGDVEMLGVENLGDSSVVIKFGVKTRPDMKWPIRRELLRRIKNTFDDRGIEIPFPHLTVFHRTENGGPAKLAEPDSRGD